MLLIFISANLCKLKTIYRTQMTKPAPKFIENPKLDCLYDDKERDVKLKEIDVKFANTLARMRGSDVIRLADKYKAAALDEPVEYGWTRHNCRVTNGVVQEAAELVRAEVEARKSTFTKLKEKAGFAPRDLVEEAKLDYYW